MSEQAKDDASLNDISLHEEDTVIPFQVEELDIRGRVSLHKSFSTTNYNKR